MVFLVAEIGVNWHGEIDYAKKMISNAFQAGANAVKFQFYGEEEIQHITNETQKKQLHDMILDYDKAKILQDFALSIGIPWFATPMYIGAIEILEALHVPIYKVRYKDRNNNPLLAKVTNTRKPVLVSVDEPKPHIYPNVHYLYCIPKYPTTSNDIDLTLLSSRSFQGFSSHIQDPYLCYAIATLLCETRGVNYVLEVHVKQNDDDNCIDANVSLSMEQLEDLAFELTLLETAFKHDVPTKTKWNMW